jgi:hypothetical protein
VKGLTFVTLAYIGCASAPAPVKVYEGAQPHEAAFPQAPQGSIFSPNGARFAYLQGGGVVVEGPGSRLDFVQFGSGKVENLTWVDDHRIAYLSGESGLTKRLFVVHDAENGKVLVSRSGSDFIWDGHRRHVAFIEGKGDKQVLLVDGKAVWPRAGATKIASRAVWSPDGHGLALVESKANAARLVVLVEFQNSQGDLVWNVPKEAERLEVFWMGANRVVIGEPIADGFKAKFAANWTVDRSAAR